MTDPTVDPGVSVTLWGSLGTGVAIAVGSAIAWFTNRHKRKAEEAASQAEGSASKAAEFANDSIQRALSRLDAEVVQLRETIRLQAEKLELMRQKEQRMALNIVRLEAHVDRLHDIMRSHNLEPPPRPTTGQQDAV
jgi:Na+/phosphate symporter